MQTARELAAFEKSTKEDIAGGLQALQTIREQAATYFFWANAGQASLENRMKALDQAVENHGNEIWELVANIEKRTDTIEKSTKEEIAGGIRAVGSDFTLANHRQASFENRMEELEKSTKEQIAGGIRWSWAMESDFTLAEHREASLENRMEELEKSTKEQIAGVLQELETQTQTARELAAMVFFMDRQLHTDRELALQTDREQAAMHLQASLENRMDAIEKSTKKQIAGAEMEIAAVDAAMKMRDFRFALRQGSLENCLEAIEEMTKNQAEALQTVTEQARRDFVSADYRQASLMSRMETIEKLTKEQMAATASLEIRFESVEKEREQIDELQTATEQAARETVWTTLCLENRMEAIEKFTKDQVEKLEQATASLENRSESIEEKLEEQIAGGLASPKGWNLA